MPCQTDSWERGASKNTARLGPSLSCANAGHGVTHSNLPGSVSRRQNHSEFHPEPPPPPAGVRGSPQIRKLRDKLKWGPSPIEIIYEQYDFFWGSNFKFAKCSVLENCGKRSREALKE